MQPPSKSPSPVLRPAEDMASYGGHSVKKRQEFHGPPLIELNQDPIVMEPAVETVDKSRSIDSLPQTGRPQISNVPPPYKNWGWSAGSAQPDFYPELKGKLKDVGGELAGNIDPPLDKPSNTPRKRHNVPLKEPQSFPSVTSGTLQVLPKPSDHQKPKMKHAIGLSPAQCLTCLEGFQSINLMIQHLSTVPEMELNDCQQCVKGWVEKERLEYHMNHHVRATCRICHQVTISDTVLPSHILSHCQRGEHTRASYLTRHGLHKPENNTEFQNTVSPASCKQAKLPHSSIGGTSPLKPEPAPTLTYKNMTHAKSIPFNKPLKTIKRLSSNIKARKASGPVHPQRNLGKIIASFSCQICGKMFMQQDNLTRHVSSFHAGYKTFHCSACTKDFSHPGLMLNHYLTVHCTNSDLTPELDYDSSEGYVTVNLRDCQDKDENLTPSSSLQFEGSHHKDDHYSPVEGDQYNSGLPTNNPSQVVVYSKQPGKGTKICKQHLPLQNPDKVGAGDKEKGLDETYTCTSCLQIYSDISQSVPHVAMSEQSAPTPSKSIPYTPLGCRNEDGIGSLCGNTETLKQLLVRCGLCGQKYASVSELEVHIKEVHSSEYLKSMKLEEPNGINLVKSDTTMDRLSNSDIQNAEFNPIWKLVWLQKQQHCIRQIIQKAPEHTAKTPLPPLDRGESLNCVYCTQQCSGYHDLMEHIQTHTGYQAYHCIRCAECFTTLIAMRNHRRKHWGGKSFKCEKCGNQYVTEVMLKIHDCRKGVQYPLPSAFDSAGKQQEYACFCCNASYIFSAHLVHHFMLHSKVYPYICTICGHGYGTFITLRNHIDHHQRKLKLLRLNEGKPKEGAESEEEEEYFCCDSAEPSTSTWPQSHDMASSQKDVD